MILDAVVSDLSILVALDDDDVVNFAFREFKGFEGSTHEQRSEWRIVDNGTALEWPDLHVYIGLDEMRHFDLFDERVHTAEVTPA